MHDILDLSNGIQSVASRARSLLTERTGTPPTREGRRAGRCAVVCPLWWYAHFPGPRAALEAPIVRPREEFGEIGVISQMLDQG